MTPSESAGTNAESGLLDVHSEQRDGVAVISLNGELDLATVPAAEPALAAAADDGVRGLVLDLRGLRFVDSSGLRFILHAARFAGEKGWQFSVVRGSEQVQRVVNVTGLDQELRFIDDPAEALSDGD